MYNQNNNRKTTTKIQKKKARNEVKPSMPFSAIYLLGRI